MPWRAAHCAMGADTCCTVNDTRTAVGDCAGMAEDEAFITTTGTLACAAMLPTA